MNYCRPDCFRRRRDHICQNAITFSLTLLSGASNNLVHGNGPMPSKSKLAGALKFLPAASEEESPSTTICGNEKRGVQGLAFPILCITPLQPSRRRFIRRMAAAGHIASITSRWLMIAGRCLLCTWSYSTQHTYCCSRYNLMYTNIYLCMDSFSLAFQTSLFDTASFYNLRHKLTTVICCAFSFVYIQSMKYNM